MDFWTVTYYRTPNKYENSLRKIIIYCIPTMLFKKYFSQMIIVETSLILHTCGFIPYEPKLCIKRWMNDWTAEPLAYWVEYSPIGWESYQRLKKWYLMPPCLGLNIIRWGSRVKWSNPVNRVAPCPTLQYSSYWKR